MHAFQGETSDELTEMEARVLGFLEQGLRSGSCPSREEISRASWVGRSRLSHRSRARESGTEGLRRIGAWAAA